MIDLSKTENLFDELIRMCESFDVCETCPLLYRGCSLVSKYDAEDRLSYLNDCVAVVQKWSDKHPRKTYADVFFELFPNAQKNADGTPTLCTWALNPTLEKKCKQITCAECWNRPYEKRK